MAANGKATSSTTTKTTTSKSRTTGQRSDTAQVREGITKARNGAVSYAQRTAERAVDVPVGAALTVRDRVTEVVEPWTSGETREKELKGLRTQVTRELNKFERRGGQARRKATQRVRSTRNRVEREVRQRRRELERSLKQNRTKARKAVKENRTRVEDGLKKAQSAVQERVGALS